MKPSLGSLLLCLGSPLAAQTTWVVPNQADLTPYIAQANPGDTLLLGAYHTGFVLDKGLTLRPQSGRTQVYFNLFGPYPQSSTTSVQTPAGQRSLLVDIDFLTTGPMWQGDLGTGHPVTASGTTSFERCTVSTLGSGGHALTTNGNVTLRHCSATTSFGSIGLGVQGGTCSAVRCQFTGANAASSLGMNDFYATPGVRITSGTFVASHCTMTPGAAQLGVAFAIPLGPTSGLLVSGGTAHLTDCTISGGHFPSGWPAIPGPYEGAPAIWAPGGSATHARCTLLPGDGGFGVPPPAPTLGNASVDGNLVGIDSSGPLLLGTTWTATAKAGDSGQLLGFGLSFGLSPSTLPFVPEPLWMDPATAILAGFSTPAAGAAIPAAIAIPNVVSLVGAELWCQALQLDGSLVRVSPLVGGVVR